jgi:NAD+ diphosphatase
VNAPILSRHAIDRRTTERDDNAALDRAWAELTARVLSITADGKIALRLGSLAYDPPAGPRPADAFYLGHDETAHWFARVVDSVRGQISGLRESIDKLEARDIALFVHATALVNWHATHTHCPRCGAATEMTRGGHVRVCPQDGSQHFPRTDPAVIVLITDAEGERVLLGRQPSWPAGRFSCLAGFVEPGESAEQAVVRETYEETAVTVRDVRYLASQPWPFPGSLMLGYRGIADPTQPIDVGQDELAEARWFSRSELQRVESGLLLPGIVSIARFMIEGWLAEA